MQKDVALAQANTLKEWAEHWQREADARGPGTGHGTVSFLLRRTARDIERIFGVRTAPEESADLPAPPPIDEVRAG